MAYFVELVIAQEREEDKERDRYSYNYVEKDWKINKEKVKKRLVREMTIIEEENRKENYVRKNTVVKN